MAAPLGNTNSAKGRKMGSVVLKRLEERKEMEALADVLIDKALSGDVTAIKEVFDRTDGKAHQSISQDINVIKEVSEVDLDTALSQSLAEAGLTTADLERLANAERH